jgi:UDP-N-acetylmuramate dehydrogenase
MSLAIEEAVPLAPLTTLKVGGAARFFAEVRSEEELSDAVAFAESRGLPLMVLGGGSNVVISDRGFDGLVVRVALRGMTFTASGDFRLATAAAGEDWDGFVSECVARGLQGIECLSGIPGTVGGTPVQNVGAYGQEVSQTIDSVRVLDTRTRTFATLSAEACGFGYRSSLFNTAERGRYIVTSVSFRLVPDGAPMTGYPSLREALRGPEPTLAEVREAVREIRRSKGMLAGQRGPEGNSAGSFFKNPIVTPEKAAAVRASVAGSDVPVFDAAEGMKKLSAAWLIEQAGFGKGTVLGAAAVSPLHSLALINRGGASAAELVALKLAIESAVEARFGIRLETEPQLVGF